MTAVLPFNQSVTLKANQETKISFKIFYVTKFYLKIFTDYKKQKITIHHSSSKPMNTNFLY